MFNLQLRIPISFDSYIRIIFGRTLPKKEDSSTRLAWIGGFPAHYMGEFHRRLEKLHKDLIFIYSSFSNEGRAFNHEITNLPEKYLQTPKRFKLIWMWICLERIKPKSILIAGNYPRVNLLAAFWAHINGREIYYLADSNPLDSKNLKRNWLNNFVLRQLFLRVTKILTIGTRNVEFYVRYCDKKSLGGLLLHFPLPHLNLNFELEKIKNNDIFTFLVFGRLDVVKAVDQIIIAYSILPHELRKRSRLLIAGDGDASSELRALVDSLKLNNQVEFRGVIPSNEAHLVYLEANALVMASIDEPWGLVVNESLSSGKPVIGPFWIGAFADLIIQGETGLITASNNPIQLSEAMQNLLNNPENAEKMGLNGRKLIKEKNWNIDGSLKAFDLLPIFRLE